MISFEQRLGATLDLLPLSYPINEFGILPRHGARQLARAGFKARERTEEETESNARTNRNDPRAIIYRLIERLSDLGGEKVPNPDFSVLAATANAVSGFLDDLSKYSPGNFGLRSTWNNTIKRLQTADQEAFYAKPNTFLLYCLHLLRSAAKVLPSEYLRGPQISQVIMSLRHQIGDSSLGEGVDPVLGTLLT